jgi:hypothetical protein
MNSLEIPFDEKKFRKQKLLWWKNPREKEFGGMSLTPQGFEAFVRAGIKNYKIKFEYILDIDSNKIILGLDNFINSPFYITHREMHVFDETTAIQLILFNGDLKKFIHSKYRNLHLT